MLKNVKKHQFFNFLSQLQFKKYSIYMLCNFLKFLQYAARDETFGTYRLEADPACSG